MANRIKALASLVPFNSVVADIGTDHAYLIAELFAQNKIKYAYAIDNKNGPLENAKKTISKYQLEEQVEVIKADGLDFNLSPKVDTLVFAGLGGMNIISIINKDVNKLKHIKTIVTDVHRDNDKLQKLLFSLNYHITQELTIEDKKKIYHLFSYQK